MQSLKNPIEIVSMWIIVLGGATTLCLYLFDPGLKPSSPILILTSAALLHAVICASLCSKLAAEKGHQEGEWTWKGCLFGIFALIAAAGLPDRKYQPGHFPESNSPPTD